MPPPATSEQSTSGVLRPIAPAKRLWVPAGNPRPPGTRVRRGECVSQESPGAGGFSLAPVDGIIAESRTGMLVGGRQTMLVALDVDATPASDLSNEHRDSKTLQAMLREADPGDWLERLRAGGVNADRWTSPDLLAQLRPAAHRKADVVICHALDLDPALPLQQSILLEPARHVVFGVAALARLAGAGKAWLVISDEAPQQSWAMLREIAAPLDVRLVATQNHYPRPTPTLLLHALLGRPLRPGTLPSSAGVVLLDSAAAMAVGACLLDKLPMLEVPFAVYDRSGHRAHLVSVPIGSTAKDVLLALGVPSECSELRAGHPLRDLSAVPDAVIANAELTLYASVPSGPVNPAPCIRCAWCVEACPVRIQPAGLLEAAQRRDPELASEYGLHACIDCGVCSYVCPSNLPLLEGIRSLRPLTSQGKGASPAREKRIG